MHEAMSDKKVIEDKLAKASHSTVISRLVKFDEALRTEGVPLNLLPEELVWFIKRYDEVEIYCVDINLPRNGWRISDLVWWPRYTVNEERAAEPDEYPYFENVWHICSYAFDGGEQIVIDLHPGPRFGRIGWLTQTDFDYGGGAIVIAKSFFEWLERTLDHGPYAQRPYWREESFKDYGPLIPDDPYYKPA